MINKNVAHPVIFHFSFDPLPESLYFPSKNIMRVLAISDIHVDHAANLEWVKHLSRWDYTEDALIVAGDISDRLSHLETTFELLKQRFAEVCFVPGNHELWIRNDGYSDSFQKFHAILNVCQQHEVRTAPFLFGARSYHPVWIVPLFGWYLKPEDGPGSLFLPKPGEDPSLAMWADHYHVKWPAGITNSAAVRYFLRFNVENGFSSSGYPVITFSHFLPRQELIFPENFDPVEARKHDRFPQFNFSRVAGCWQLDEQLRALGSTRHIYGHQHRNRHREINGVTYISHCLGYPVEWQDNAEPVLPKVVWEAP